MMALRTISNNSRDITILNVLKTLLPLDPITLQPNTVIGQNQVTLSAQAGKPVSLIYVQQKYLMVQGAFPAVLLASGAQHHRRNSRSTYEGLFVAEVQYYDRWDKQDSTIDDIWANIALDLERMKANVQDNDSLAYGGAAYAISIPEILMGPYKGEVEEVEGMTLVHRDMTLNINLLPYDNFEE